MAKRIRKINLPLFLNNIKTRYTSPHPNFMKESMTRLIPSTLSNIKRLLTSLSEITIFAPPSFSAIAANSIKVVCAVRYFAIPGVRTDVKRSGRAPSPQSYTPRYTTDLRTWAKYQKPPSDFTSGKAGRDFGSRHGPPRARSTSSSVSDEPQSFFQRLLSMTVERGALECRMCNKTCTV